MTSHHLPAGKKYSVESTPVALAIYPSFKAFPNITFFSEATYAKVSFGYWKNKG